MLRINIAGYVDTNILTNMCKSELFAQIFANLLLVINHEGGCAYM